jgi:hypothetical protein
MGGEMGKELSLKGTIFTDLLQKHSQCNQRLAYVSVLCGILSSDSSTKAAGGRVLFSL